MSFWSQVSEITRVDLVVERRVGETLKIVLPFAVVALFVFPLAIGFQLSILASAGPAIFWSLGLLFGMQIALRRTADDTAERRDLMALLGVDPAARFVGRTISGSVLTLAFLLVLFLAMTLLFGPDLPSGSWFLVGFSTVLMAVGLTELATLAGELTTGLANRSALASLIVAPLSIPLVIGASQSLEALRRSETILPWVLLMVTTDLALAVIGVAMARPLEEATR